MKHNVGGFDRIVRGVLGAGLVGVAVAMSMPLVGVVGGGVMLTAMCGRCLGYRLLGASTCQR